MIERKYLFLIGTWGLLTAIAQPSFAEGWNMSECKEVRTVMQDPLPPIGDEAAEMVAGIVCKKVQELAPIFGVEVTGRRMVRLMITDSMESFHKITGRGKYTIAAFSPTFGIVTQPPATLQTLSDTHKLESTLAHELTHYFIYRVAGPTCPSWIHEGLAQWFEGIHPKQGIILGMDKITSMEARWRNISTPIDQRSRDYLTSLMLVAKIIRRAGLENFIASLKEIKSYPNALDLPVNGRTIRQWLLSADEPKEPKDSNSSQLEILRGEQWQRRLEEEFSQQNEDGKTIHLGYQEDGEVTPLPLKELLEKAKKNKASKEN